MSKHLESIKFPEIGKYDTDHLARIDGYYEDMTVGRSENFVTNLSETESEPFTFRTSGGNLEIGDREELKVVGGSVAWNQLVSEMRRSGSEKGLTFTRNADGSLDISGTITEAFDYNYISFTSTDIKFKRDGRKYLLMLNKPIPYGWGVSGYGTTISANSIGGMWSDNTGTDWTNGFVLRAEVGTTIDIQNLRAMLFDLTQMFGTTIADYIYSLEQTTAGAGVAFFKKYFPNDYYAYNAGEMLHVQTSEFKTVGFNQWDEEWEQGYYYSNSSGKIAKGASTTTIRSKNPIPVFPNTAYHITGTVYRYFFCDENDVVISYGNNANFTTPVNATRLYFYCENISTYNHDICINLHWDETRDGEYEPYTEHSYPLDDSLTLRGIPKLDADNNLYFDGDTYDHDGTVTRKYGIVDLGTLNYTRGVSSVSGLTYFDTTDVPNKKIFSAGSGPANIMSPKFIPTPNNYSATSGMPYGYMYSAGIYVTFYANYSDVASFKTAMSGVYLVYELATPTTEEAEPYQTPQIVDNWGTEEFVVPTQSGVEIPVGHETVYPINLRDKVESSPNLPDGDGDYIMRMNSGVASYVKLASQFPAPPTENGNYVLKATVTNGTATLTWEAQS